VKDEETNMKSDILATDDGLDDSVQIMGTEDASSELSSGGDSNGGVSIETPAFSNPEQSQESYDDKDGSRDISAVAAEDEAQGIVQEDSAPVSEEVGNNKRESELIRAG
jgi:hypothetical protein